MIIKKLLIFFCVFFIFLFFLSGTQHNTTQHNTTQHNTTQHKITQLNQFYGKPGAETNLVMKRQYGREISEIINKGLIGKDGYVNINGLEFNLYDGLNKRETAEKQVREIEMILNSSVGYFLEESVKTYLRAMLNETNTLLDELGEEYDDFYSMDREVFLAQTKCVYILTKTIDELKSSDDSSAIDLLRIATDRLKELGVGIKRNHISKRLVKQTHGSKEIIIESTEKHISPKEVDALLQIVEVSNFFKRIQVTYNEDKDGTSQDVITYWYENGKRTKTTVDESQGGFSGQKKEIIINESELKKELTLPLPEDARVSIMPMGTHCGSLNLIFGRVHDAGTKEQDVIDAVMPQT